MRSSSFDYDVPALTPASGLNICMSFLSQWIFSSNPTQSLIHLLRNFAKSDGILVRWLSFVGMQTLAEQKNNLFQVNALI